MEILDQRIETIGLPLRASNVLRWYDINTVGELVQHSRKELLHMHGFGKRCLAAVDAYLSENNLDWER